MIFSLSDCNSQLTYADLAVFTFLNSYFLKGKAEGIPEQLKDYPNLSTWYELIRTHPKILEWLKNPPADIVDYIYWYTLKAIIF